MVRTRIAPSPTGEDLHIGNLYTALLNWAFARKDKKEGAFIVRIEDTDRERLVPGAEEKILSSLKIYGLDYDEGPDAEHQPYGPYRQSERLALYKKHVLELISKDEAYYCICSKERLKELRERQIAEKKQTRYDKYCLIHRTEVEKEISKGKPYVIRLNVRGNQEIHFTDLIRGEIVFNSNEVDDQVLLKSDGYPTYHLAVVVDDYFMKITHVIRAEEWISSTPKHILIYKAFGWKLPHFAHVPILRNPDKSKLSKRKNPVWVSWYLQEGYLPKAVLNYLMLLGWSHPQQKEIFTKEEFIKHFDLVDLKTVGPVFDLTKLTWLNQQYIQREPDSDLKKDILSYYSKAYELPVEVFDKLLPLIKTRMATLKDFIELTKFFFSSSTVQLRSEKEKQAAKDLYLSLKDISLWDKESILQVFKDVMKKRDIRMPVLYYVCTGAERGLPLPESLEILGRKETLKRLERLV